MTHITAAFRVMEDWMMRLRGDSGMGRTPWIALIGVLAIMLAACGPAASPTAEETEPAESQPGESQPAADLEPVAMRVGALVPQTGGLSGIVGALEEGLRMGEEEINAVEDGLVTIDFADDGTDDTVSSENVQQFLTGDHNAIIGPAASGNAVAIWDAVNTANMVMCSGTSTGSTFSSEEYNPNHVRTAPSDDIQGPLLGNVMLEDGFTDVAVVWQSTEYGEGFGQATADSLEAAGANLVMSEGFDPTQTSFTDLAQEIVSSGAEAVAMITYAEGAQIVLDLESAGFEGQIYVADGFVDNVTVDSVGGDAALLEGIRGTYPAVAPSNGEPTFPDRFAEFAPPDTPTVFSAHMYDCLAVLTLAAQVAQSSDPTVYVDEIIGVTRDGEKCELIADCLEMVWAGTDIDYDGASGPLDFSPNGEPALGTYNVIQYDAEGVSQNEEEIQGQLPS
jgi:branched-chain amino acid transport system substrate-binding protein